MSVYECGDFPFCFFPMNVIYDIHKKEMKNIKP